MISVVIPLYNKEKQIRKTLQSVFAQTYTDYEVVIVNDGSTDNSVKVVEEIIKEAEGRRQRAGGNGQQEDDTVSFARIRLIHQENAGVSAARNKGIAEAQGEYIAFLDADDEWKPEYLATQADMIKRYPECEVFATNYSHVTSDGKNFPTILRKIPFSGKEGLLTNYFEVASHSHPPICSICVVATKHAFNSIGGFPKGIKSGEDLLTWARLACKYKIAYSIEPLAIYNMGEGYDFSNTPSRLQDNGDPVGHELKKLYVENNREGLREYISLWHKMRASVAIRFGDRKEAVRESFLSLRYNPLNYKILPFFVLSIMPTRLRKKVIASYK